MEMKMIWIIVTIPVWKDKDGKLHPEKIEEHGFLYESEAFTFVGDTLRTTDCLKLTWERTKRDVKPSALNELIKSSPIVKKK